MKFPTPFQTGLFLLALPALLVLASCTSESPEPKEEAPVEDKAETAPESEAPASSEKATQPAAPEKEETETVADAQKETAAKPDMKEKETASDGKTEIATLGGGCFWCTEAVLERIEGVTDVVSGYMGGHVENPTYEEVCGMRTGHAEVIQVTFDPSIITYEEVLDIFWQAHDPTTLNRQGNDRGPQYRSVIFYHTPEQKIAAEKSKAILGSSGTFEDPIVTEITEASTFWKAEEKHQDYYQNNKNTNPYCPAVITPKLKKLGLEI